MFEETPIKEEHLRELRPELRAILDQELAAGNRISCTSKGWGDPDAIFVQLHFPFIVKQENLPAGVQYNLVNDTHWWLAEYVHMPSKHLLACSFDLNRP